MDATALAKRNRLMSENESAISEIRANRDLSFEATQRELAKNYVSYLDKLKDLEHEVAGTTANRVTILQRKLFGLPTNSDAQAMLSYRDAADRVAQLTFTDERTALKMLDNAETIGDQHLVRAIIGAAFAMKWMDTLQAHVNRHPELTDDVQELLDSPRYGQSVQTSFLAAGQFIPATPTEISHLGEYRIRALAKN